jgi:hypothetical protein
VNDLMEQFISQVVMHDEPLITRILENIQVNEVGKC